ncbi:MAG: hypothetical protein V1882_10205 [Candidatus Omnitrophota bacterium]
MLKTSRFLSGFFLLILGVSPVAFCASDPLASGTSPTKAAGTSQAPAPALTEPVSGIDTAIQKAQEEVRDPFAITAETKAAVTAAPVTSAALAAPVVTVLLEGIGFGNKDAYALIGGDVYFVGDDKNGIKLVEVRRREVDVLVNGGLMTVSLFPKEELQKIRDRADKKAATMNALQGQPVEGVPSFVAPGDEASSQTSTPLPRLEGDTLPT